MTEIDAFRPVYIIGNTPLAAFLSVKLSLAGENVYRLGTHNQDPTQTYTIKDTETGQKYSACLPAGNIMHHPAKMTILCLDYKSLRADLAYFSAAKNSATPVISFCHADPVFLSKIIHAPVIPAYFNGWLETEKNENILFRGAPQGITLSISEQHPLFYDIRQTLAKTNIELHFSENDTYNFWHAFIAEIIPSLFLLYSHSNFKDIAKNNKLRSLLSSLIDEINSIIPENLQYNKEDLTTYIYALPHDYIPSLFRDLTIGKTEELNFILSVLQKRPSFNSLNCPFIFRILKEQLDKKLSPVE